MRVVLSGVVAVAIATGPGVATASPYGLPVRSLRAQEVAAPLEPASTSPTPAVGSSAPPARPSYEPPQMLEEEPRSGRSGLIGGGIVTGAGALMIAGGLFARLVEKINCAGHCYQYSDPHGGSTVLLILGGVVTVTGIVVLSVGGARNSRWHRWRERQRVGPVAYRTAMGTWSAGLTLRF